MWYVRLCACLWATEEMMSVAPLPPRGNKSRVWQNNASFPTYESRRALLRCINTLSDLAHETTWNWLLGLRNISPFEVPVICLISKMFFQWFVKEKKELYPTLGIAKRNKAWGQGNGGFLEVCVCVTVVVQLCVCLPHLPWVSDEWQRNLKAFALLCALITGKSSGTSITPAPAPSLSSPPIKYLTEGWHDCISRWLKAPVRTKCLKSLLYLLYLVKAP